MSTHIRDTRAKRGLTIYDLARVLEVTPGAVSQMEKSESNGSIKMSTLERALRAMGADLSTEVHDAPLAAKRMLTSRAAADAIRRMLAAGDQDSALRLAIQSLEHFAEAKSAKERADFLRKPASTGDLRWDTLLATAVKWKARQIGLKAPAWTEKPALPGEWLPATADQPSEEFLSMIRRESAPEFTEKRILIRERDLATA